jgi:WhiB family redox-sensing transcriptional regulator
MTARQRHSASPIWAAPDLALSTDVDAEPHWTDLALCAETDPELFFPEKGQSTLAAKRTCMACDVRAECLQYALENNERFGIWGGKSERQRRKLREELAAGQEVAA